MNYQSSAVEVNELINSCVQVESLKINRQRAIPQQVCFHLNAETIERIEEIKARQTKFVLSSENLAALRCYALFNLSPNLKPQRHWQPDWSQASLVFSTQYAESTRKPTTLLRSTLNLEGKISQQIKQELVQNAPMLERVTEAHYWLTTEIISQLPLKSKVWYSKLIYRCLASAILIVCILLWYFLPQGLLFKLTICFSLVGALLMAISFSKRLKSWTIHQLVVRVFSQRTISRRKLGLKILNFLI